MIYINTIDENTVWVTSDNDSIGVEVRFDSDVLEEEKALIALSEFFGCDTSSIFCFDSIDNGVSWTVEIGGAR